MKIGDKIRVHRKALGLTQTELGAKLGVKKNAVSKWECGRVDDIPGSKVKMMATLFGVPASYLIDEEADTFLNTPVADLTGEQEKPVPTRGDELSDYDRRVLSWFHSLPQEKRQAILSLGDGPAEPDDLDKPKSNR